MRRVVVGLILATVGLTSIFDLRIYTVLILCVALGCLNELSGLIKRKGESLVVPVAYLGTLAYIILAAFGRLAIDEGTLLALTILGAFAWAMLGQRSGYLARVGATLLAVLYLGKLLSYFIAIRRLPAGEMLSIFLIIIVACTDIFAMLVGRAFGRHPLTPISPSKTVEGAIGGLMCAVIGGTIFAHVVHLDLPLWQSIATQLGDIVESALKRDASVKDAGTAFQSHGGVLDRFDSYLFGGIAFYGGLFVSGTLPLIGAS
jgi:phosphatidate cytidylyltransferase